MASIRILAIIQPKKGFGEKMENEEIQKYRGNQKSTQHVKKDFKVRFGCV